MSGRKYSIVVRDMEFSKPLYFTEMKEFIAKFITMNPMQSNKIIRCNSLKAINTCIHDLGYKVELVPLRKANVYAFYHKDEYVCSGTIREIAKRTGKSVRHLQDMATPGYKKKFPHRDRFTWLEKLEEEVNES